MLFRSTDNYRWVMLSNVALDTAETIKVATMPGTTTSLSGITTTSGLNSNQFLQVYRNTNTFSTASAQTVITASTGSIYSIRIVSGGTGYSVNDAFTVYGDGTSTASGIVVGVNPTTKAITALSVSSNGFGYTTGVVKFTSSNGVGAVLIPRIAPLNGFGYDVVADLPAWYAAFAGQFTYSALYPGTSDVPNFDSLRQVSLIRNPIVFTSSTGSTYTYRCLKYITVDKIGRAHV